MNVKKVYLLFFLLVMIGQKNFSQSNVDAQKIIDHLSVKIKAAKGISATFDIKQFDKYNHAMVNSDGLVKVKGNKYYLKEDQVEVFCNGVQTWNFDGDREVTVSTASNDEDDITPQQILSGFDKKDFTYNLLTSTGNTNQILLKPIDKRKNFKQLVLFINKSNNLISKAKITDKMGVLTEIDFTAITLNATFPDKLFIFDASKHPNIEIINQ